MVPNINDEFENYGNNNGGLIVLAIFSSGSDAQCLEWDTRYNVKYPSISGRSGGSEVFDSYRVSATPTLVLITPDREIVEKDIWPISSLPSTLAKYNINTTGSVLKNNILLKPVYAISAPGILPKINVSVALSDVYTLSIFSLNGGVQNIYHKYLASGDHTFSISQRRLAQGTYILKLGNRDTSGSLKLIVP